MTTPESTPDLGLAAVYERFAELCDAAPQQNATIATARQAVESALDVIQRNSALVSWETTRQQKHAAERVAREQADTAQRQAKIKAARDLLAPQKASSK